MKRLKLILSIVSVVILLTISFVNVVLAEPASKAGDMAEEGHIEIREIEEIAQLQTMTSRTDIPGDNRVMKMLGELIEGIEKAVPVGEEEAKELELDRGYYFISIGFLYKDGTKDMFFFFHHKDSWYMETEDGHYYKNVEFFGKRFRYEKAGEVIEPFGSLEDFEKEVKLAAEFDGLLDMRYTFSKILVLNQNKPGFSEEKEVETVAEWLREQEIKYQYAVRHGYVYSEEQLKEYMDRYVKGYTGVENHEKDYKKIYSRAGITAEEFIQKQEDLLRERSAVNALYKARWEEFRTGQDTINGKVCESMDEYWNTYMEEIIRPEIEEIGLGDFEERLEEAEKYYYVNHSVKMQSKDVIVRFWQNPCQNTSRDNDE